MSTDIYQLRTSDAGVARTHFRAVSLIETTLDILPIGIVLVDANLRIVHCNVAANEMMHAGEPIVSHNGLLRASCKFASTALVRAANQGVQMIEGNCGVTNVSIPLSYEDGRVAIAHVRPLTRDITYFGSDKRAAVAIFITGSTEYAPLPFETLAKLFDLTRSETRVVNQIVLGRNRRETADALGIADSTVKSHLERIYFKTATSDQLGLCRLITALSWPVGRSKAFHKD